MMKCPNKNLGACKWMRKSDTCVFLYKIGILWFDPSKDFLNLIKYCACVFEKMTFHPLLSQKNMKIKSLPNFFDKFNNEM